MPMDEARAQHVIAEVFENEGVKPEAGRAMALAPGAPIKLEVAATGHLYGVVWLTPAIKQQLGTLVPKHDNDEGSLVVLDGAGTDKGGHALLLWGTDYMTDDLDGTAHTETEIAAEKRLQRDVRDFVYKAKTDAWP